MRAIATESASSRIPAREHRRNAHERAVPGTVSGISTPGRLAVQRTAGCACGGGCLRCTASHSSGSALVVNAPGDAYEQEADRVAEQVMRMADPSPAAGSCIGGNCIAAAQPTAMAGNEAGHGGMVQAKESPGKMPHIAPGLQQRIESLRGGGEPLPDRERAFFEPRLGYDLGSVRLHRGSHAAETARAVNALAYTVGSDVVFGAGQYAPESDRGRQLLAHELVHVIQQRDTRRLQRIIGDGHDLSSNRFKGNVELEDVFDGPNTIGRGSRGLHVTIIQQALADAGFSLGVAGVDGRFGRDTQAAVQAFQRSKGLAGAAANGVVNATTINLLDQHFLGHHPEHRIATDAARPLADGTRALNAADAAAANAAIITEPVVAGGGQPVFQRTIAGQPDPYEVRLRDRLNAVIQSQHMRLVASRPARTAANLMSAADINRLALAAKTVTDAVFGRYATGPPMTFGVNITDQFVERDTEIAASQRNADWAANWRVLKILDGDSAINQIDQQHGAVQSRSAEWGLIAGITGFPNQSPTVLDYDANPPHVTTGIVGAHRAELLDIHRNWPASAGGGNIHLQRYLAVPGQPNHPDNRDIMYRTFATVIHEYIHTLENARHQQYRTTLAQRRGGFVLREGMTDYLSKIVWDNVNFDAVLRATIEDRFQDPAQPAGHTIPLPPRYPEWINAERLVGIVGVRNAMSAFFLGQVDLIGGP